jgi:pyruvate dehydrogenase (quinone)
VGADGISWQPEYVVEFSRIDFTKYAEACGGRGYSIREPAEVESIISQAFLEKKPTIIEAYVDPFEPPMRPKVEMKLISNMAESLARGQPYGGRIGLTLFRDKVHEAFKKITFSYTGRRSCIKKKLLSQSCKKRR